MTQHDAQDHRATDAAPAQLIVSVCTYRRNEQLRRLLNSLLTAADEARSVCAVGVVVVDDNADRSAAPVVAESRSSSNSASATEHPATATSRPRATSVSRTGCSAAQAPV